MIAQRRRGKGQKVGVILVPRAECAARADAAPPALNARGVGGLVTLCVCRGSEGRRERVDETNTNRRME